MQHPVLVFPSHLDFYFEDQTTHKRVLTIYNPYDDEVTFKVLCNNPSHYAAVEPQGRISRETCADVVVRHVAISPQAVRKTDKFRIQVFNSANDLLGVKDILATLYPGYPESGHGDTHSMPHIALRQSSSCGGYQHEKANNNISSNRDTNGIRHSSTNHPNILAYLIAFASIVCLFLPTDRHEFCGGDSSSTSSDKHSSNQYTFWILSHPYLQVSFNLKLVASYVLGLVTLVIMKPT